MPREILQRWYSSGYTKWGKYAKQEIEEGIIGKPWMLILLSCPRSHKIVTAYSENSEANHRSVNYEQLFTSSIETLIISIDFKIDPCFFFIFVSHYLTFYLFVLVIHISCAYRIAAFLFVSNGLLFFIDLVFTIVTFWVFTDIWVSRYIIDIRLLYFIFFFLDVIYIQ